MNPILNIRLLLQVLVFACAIDPISANARIVSPDPLIFQNAGQIRNLNIADQGSCNADILVTSLDFDIVRVASTSPNPTEGVNVDMQIEAVGVGTAQLLVQWIEKGSDSLGSPCNGDGFVFVDVLVGPVPLVIQVLDASIGLPITNAQVYAREPVELYGFRAFPTLAPGIYRSSAADVQNWNMKVFAPGYLPSPGVTLKQKIDGSLAGTISLTPGDPSDNSSVLKVRVRLLDPQGIPTGQFVLTESIRLIRNSTNLGLTPTFNRGFMIYPGVPAGTINISAPDTSDIDFGSTTISVGTGVTRTVSFDARLVSSTDVVSIRAGLPGSIIGDVFNSSANPQDIVSGAVIISKQDANDISTYTTSNEIGAYFHANITAGSGKLYALSPDETIQGPTNFVNIVAGRVYGDDQQEDSTLTVPLAPADSDGDGLPDDFEEQYLSEVPEDLRGPDDDPDGDGLTNLEEFQLGTDPAESDSDGDGTSDGVEIERGTDPTDSQSFPPLLSEVWVDFGYDAPLQAGTLLYPAGDLALALSLLQNGGTITVKGDVETTTGNAPNTILDTPLRAEANNGTITIIGVTP